MYCSTHVSKSVGRIHSNVIRGCSHIMSEDKRGRGGGGLGGW